MTNGIGKPQHLQDFVMSTKRPEFDLCSEGERDEYLEIDLHSPTDSSEDSVEVKVFPISPRNKRKCTEPRRVQETFAPPLKKRLCFKIKNELDEPFRPWRISNATVEPNSSDVIIKPEPNFLVPQIPQTLLESQMLHEPKPLPLIKKEFIIKTEPVEPKIEIEYEASSNSCLSPGVGQNLRVPVHPCLSDMAVGDTERMIINSTEAFPSLQPYDQRKEQRNYKNMTRERRIEANARERTRVHTISAAFETLRRSVPSYSHNQKLSKLSVLRIACSYIMTLSTLLGDTPVTERGNTSTLAECIDNVSKTIQKEGKLRKKKDESD